MTVRRAPAPEARQRDAERTRRALLDAALVEFADKGRAGARVSEIAERAGVNKQLISYYFGGKDGLYEAIVERWTSLESSWDRDQLPLDELVLRYLGTTVEHRDMQRFFVRTCFEDDGGVRYPGPDGEPLPRQAIPEVVEMAWRQAAGEIADDLDPAMVLLMLQSMVCVGVVLPADVRELLGVDPASAAFVEQYGDQVRRVVRRLALPLPE